MADFVLQAQQRTLFGKKVDRLRHQGLVPIVIYGPNTVPIHLQVPYRELEVTLMNAGGTNLIDITSEGSNQTVLARDVQRDVIRGDILHVDFFAVDQDVAIAADVQVNLIGESPVVAAREGIILPGTSTITIETLPGKLLHEIEVDLSGLKEIGDSIYVRDLDLGPEIKILNDPEEMIVRIAQPAAARAITEMEEEEAVAEEMEEGTEPELIRRGREEEE